MAETGVDDAFTYIFTWRTSRDNKVCPICNPLDGEVIFFDLFSDILISDTAGPVWDLNLDRSLLHGASGTCRCKLEVEVEVDWEQMAEFRELRENLRKVNINISWIKERFKLSSNLSQAREDVRQFKSEVALATTQILQFERSLNRSLNIVKRLSGGDENLKRAIDSTQRLTTVVNSLRLAYRALQVARMAAGDPIAWATAIISGVEVAFTVADSMAMEADTH